MDNYCTRTMERIEDSHILAKRKFIALNEGHKQLQRNLKKNPGLKGLCQEI